MKYEYTAYIKNDEARYKVIAEDILSEYPNLGELAYEAAKLEKPFGRVHEDYWEFADYENKINRLIDIIIVTDGKNEYQEEYNKALKEIKTQFENWKNGFCYANPQEQEAYRVMETLEKHLKDNSVKLITFNGAREMKLKEAQERYLKAIRSLWMSLRQRFVLWLISLLSTVMSLSLTMMTISRALSLKLFLMKINLY